MTYPFLLCPAFGVSFIGGSTASLIHNSLNYVKFDVHIFTTGVSDFISVCIKEPCKAAPTKISHTFGIGMGRTLGKHAGVN